MPTIPLFVLSIYGKVLSKYRSMAEKSTEPYSASVNKSISTDSLSQVVISYLITSKTLSKVIYKTQLIIKTLRCLLFSATLDNI